MKMVRGSILSRCATVHCPSTEQSKIKYSDCTVNPDIYKADETCLTQTKRDPDDVDDPTRFQP